MANEGYTPGPIRTQEIGGIYDLRTEGGRSVACVLREPDARLYSLAPEIVIAARDLLECLDQHERLGHVRPDPRWDAARALLAKVSP